MRGFKWLGHASFAASFLSVGGLWMDAVAADRPGDTFTVRPIFQAPEPPMPIHPASTFGALALPWAIYTDRRT